jgi:hypothetical protein
VKCGPNSRPNTPSRCRTPPVIVHRFATSCNNPLHLSIRYLTLLKHHFGVDPPQYRCPRTGALRRRLRPAFSAHPSCFADANHDVSSGDRRAFHLADHDHLVASARLATEGLIRALAVSHRVDGQLVWSERVDANKAVAPWSSFRSHHTVVTDIPPGPAHRLDAHLPPFWQTQLILVASAPTRRRHGSPMHTPRRPRAPPYYRQDARSTRRGPNTRRHRVPHRRIR